MIQQAAILCGGRGTRLGAIAADTPKPLLPVGDGPFLDVLVFELARRGISKILLLAGFHALKIIDYAASTPLKARFGLEIVVSVERQPAGTGGALWHVRDQLEDRFFLLDGDTWFDINLLALAGQMPEDASAYAVWTIRRGSGSSSWPTTVSSVSPSDRHSPGSGLISGGSMS